MAITNKKVFEQFHKSCAPQAPQAPKAEETLTRSLYSQFKSLEQELTQILDKQSSFPIVLEQHISFTNSKSQITSLLTQLFTNLDNLPLIESKRLDERFWLLIKKELRRCKQEKKLKPQLASRYQEHITRTKDQIFHLLKQSWQVFDPLKDLHFPESFVRKLFNKLFLCVGETWKRKSKTDKAVLALVKDFYMRSNKVYSFSSRCLELLGIVHHLLGDLFGAVYWLTRSLSLPGQAETRDKLVSVYEELRLKWEKHSKMTKVSSQPAWHVSFCLSFLRIQGIFLTGVNTENLQVLFRTCSEHMDAVLAKNENSSLLVSMIVIWIFSVHVAQKSLNEVPELINHDSMMFDTLTGQAASVLELMASFVLRLMQSLKVAESPWLSPLLVLLYWLQSFKSLRKHFLAAGGFRNELARIEDLIPPGIVANGHLLLPEDSSIIGFLPLHHFYIEKKAFCNTQAQQGEEMAVRMKSVKDLAKEVLEYCEDEEKVNSEDEFFGLSSNEKAFDFPGLTFEENSKQLVVIDGPNVAVRHGNGNFSCKGLRIALSYFLMKGFDVKVVVPEQFLIEDRAEELKFKGAKGHKIPIGLQILKDLDEQGFLIKTPPMDYDDSYSLQYAKNKNGFVVSNDRFWDHIKKHPEAKDWIREKTCSFTFAGDDFLPNPDFVFT